MHAAAISTTDAVHRDPERARAVNVDGHGAAGGLVRPPRSPPDLHLDRPGLRRDEALVPRGRPRRAGPRSTAGPSSPPSPPSWRSRAAWWPASACNSARPGRVASRTSTGRSLALRQGRPQTFFEDEFRTPLDLPTAAAILVRLVASDVTGLAPRRGSRAGQPLRARPPDRGRAGASIRRSSAPTGTPTSRWPSPAPPTSRSTPPGSPRASPTRLGRRSTRPSPGWRDETSSSPGGPARWGV